MASRYHAEWPRSFQSVHGIVKETSRPDSNLAAINQRNNENDIALQALPTDPTYNDRRGGGVDVLMGGGRRFFVPGATADEEGRKGRR